uniref:Uncharacterized protein n=1 Tax=Arundo donax TaxID=35708 RepID=A0A0A8YRW0_ARUDO
MASRQHCSPYMLEPKVTLTAKERQPWPSCLQAKSQNGIGISTVDENNLTHETLWSPFLVGLLLPGRVA